MRLISDGGLIVPEGRRNYCWLFSGTLWLSSMWPSHSNRISQLHSMLFLGFQEGKGGNFKVSWNIGFRSPLSHMNDQGNSQASPGSRGSIFWRKERQGHISKWYRCRKAWFIATIFMILLKGILKGWGIWLISGGCVEK